MKISEVVVADCYIAVTALPLTPGKFHWTLVV